MVKRFENMIKQFFKEIKYAYQRVVYGYDDRIYWGVDDYFTQFVKPIETFCKNQLENKDYMRLNPKRYEIYSEILVRIEAWRKMSDADHYKEPNQQSQLWSYIGENIGYLWD